MEQNNEFLEIAKKAAKKGGEVLLKYFRKNLDFQQKEDKSFVSIADRESEEEIKKIILEKFPTHKIIGEESGESGQGEISWHIDPLDGTTNFKEGIASFCVSIGIERKKEFIIGVIYNPCSNELFYAEKGKGAYLNEEKIGVNNQNISEGVIVFDASFRGESGKTKVQLQRDFLNYSSRFRMIGSNALQLAELARGSYVLSISDNINTYDFAAGIVIVKEAGGIVTDHLGKKPASNSKIIIASNNLKNHAKAIEITKKYYFPEKKIRKNTYKVCILAGGIGSRMAEFSKTFNKAMIPVQGKPTICHIIEKFPEDVEIVIVVGYKKETIIDFLSHGYPKRKFTFFEVEKHSGIGAGPGYAVLECKHLLQCPFIFFAADTLVKEDIPGPNENWFGIAEVIDTSRFCSASIDEKGFISKIDDKIKCDNKYAFIGLAGIKDYNIFFDALEKDKTLIKGEIQVSNGFRGLMKKGMKGIVFTWFDTGDPNSYKHALENYPDGEGYKGQFF